MPFTGDHRRLALAMKDAGLLWEPQVGCFVWDKEGRIETGSPFGDGIYFILDLKPFLRRFASLDRMSKDLVWLPTLDQALWLCKNLDIDNDAMASLSAGINPPDGSQILLALYELILMTLKTARGVNTPPQDHPPTSPAGTCGPLDDVDRCFRDPETDLPRELLAFFSSRKLAVLATQHGGEPYASLVAFAATDDLKTIIFATTRSTRKYAYLSSNPAVALLIDDRTNEASDFRNAMAVTAIGNAQEIVSSREKTYLRLYLKKHPYLQEFVSSPTCALVKVHVKTYFTVRRFQHVLEFHIG